MVSFDYDPYSNNEIKEFFKSKEFKMCGDTYFLYEKSVLSEKFNSNWLVFAENYRICLIIESSEFGLTVSSSPNAKCRMVLKLTAPSIKELKKSMWAL